MDENLKMASSDESNPEILGEGPLSHGITDKVLEFAYGWHLRRQTFTSMEEAELDNQAASMAIRHISQAASTRRQKNDSCSLKKQSSSSKSTTRNITL